MLHPIKTAQHPVEPKFTSNIRFEPKAEFKRNCPPVLQQDVLYLSDSPFRSRGWKKYSAIIQDFKKRHSAQAKCFPWDINSIRKDRDIYTGTVITGVAGGITDGQSGVRFNLSPESSNLADLQMPFAPTLANPIYPIPHQHGSRLKQQLMASRSCLEPINQSALMLGGNVNLECYRQASRYLFEQMRNMLKAAALDPSYFWGQDSEKTNNGVKAYYTANNDTWHIYKPKPSAPFGTLKTIIYSQLGRFGWSPTLEPVSTIQDLKDTFSEIHLGKGDTLYLGSSPRGITAPELEQALYQLDHPAAVLSPTPDPSSLRNPFLNGNAQSVLSSSIPALGYPSSNPTTPNLSDISGLTPSQKSAINF